MEAIKGLGYIILGVFILIIFSTLLFLLIEPFLSPEIECDNKADWSVIKETVKKLDTNKDNQINIQFTNSDCSLVGFSEKDDSHNIRRGKGVLAGARICLCEISSSECNAYECLSLKNIKEIKTKDNQQPTSSLYEDYINIQFNKKGETLTIDFTGEHLKEIPLTYEHNEKFKEIDLGLIKKLKIKLEPSLIKNIYNGFIPKVKIIEDKQFLPKEIPQEGLLPFLFEIELGATDNTNEFTIDQFKNSNFDINPESITFSTTELSIPSIYLPSEEKDLNLYYYKNNQWIKKGVICSSLGTDPVNCVFSLEGFSNKFAISV